MDFSTVKSVYFIGIAGAGVSGLARLAKLSGKQVQGSDLRENDTTLALQREGITVYLQPTSSTVPLDYDLYVYSDAVPESQAERATLIAKGLANKTMTYFKAVGEFMREYKHRIAISGTHGKTTTTAMMSLVLDEAKYDPSAIVGSVVKQWHSNVQIGKTKEYFIVEACEYKAHMLELSPTVIILTNIEEDHLDYYRDLEHIQNTFQQYVNLLPKDGLFVRNADDSESREIDYDGDTISYGITETADIMATDIEKDAHTQSFKVAGHHYVLNVPGDFNIYNALAAIACAVKMGIPHKTIQIALKKFTGTWRRFEVVGQYREAVVISDYAHHPTAIMGTIKAAREFYPGRRIVIVFQPHQHNRTQRLFKKFVTAFDQADLIIIQEIYDVAGREAAEDQVVTSSDLVREIEQTGKLVLYAADQTKTRQLLAEHVEPNDVVLIVGAGDIYMIADDITKASS